MRHFDFLDRDAARRLFLREPQAFTQHDPAAAVGASLGATLYCPATRPSLAADIIARRAQGTQCVVVCLEDAVADRDVGDAERNLLGALRTLAATSQALPLVFVRVRIPEQIDSLIERLGPAVHVLAGFVLPKFDNIVGADALAAIAAARERTGLPLLAMPVLETATVAHVETRRDALLDARRLVDKYREMVAAVRFGATDVSAALGLRRPREFTVWDVRVVADALGDVVNIFGRAEAGSTVGRAGTGGRQGYPVSGPVWEYFPRAERMFRPHLRQTPFATEAERALRAELLAADLDGLIREVALDRANGLDGKTVIHPSHVAAVNALSVVSAEEYADARQVLDTEAAGGAAASPYGNKMNESKPHTAWASRVDARARAFGVARPEVTFVDLLAASLHR